jgi:hypothetical protein
MIKKYIINCLQTEISFKKPYLTLLKYLTGLKALTHTLSFDDFDKNIINGDLQSTASIREALKPTYVLVREKSIECSADFKNTIDHLKLSDPHIKISPSFENIIKWTTIELSFITQCRKYLMPILAEIKILLNTDLNFGTNVRQINPDEIELDRRVRTTEEIIELFPYVRSAKRSLLYKIPIFKKPVYKLYFSDSQINNFKEALANKAKTRKTNIEIISIYDKFNLENYSGIKQDSENKGLYCYLNTRTTASHSSEMYYLIIGQKKDTKEVIKTLIAANENS